MAREWIAHKNSRSSGALSVSGGHSVCQSDHCGSGGRSTAYQAPRKATEEVKDAGGGVVLRCTLLPWRPSWSREKFKKYEVHLSLSLLSILMFVYCLFKD